MPIQLAISLGGIFISVGFTVGFVLWVYLHGQAPERKRLRELAKPSDDRLSEDRSRLIAEANVLAERIAGVFPRTPARMKKIRQRLIAAGYRSHTAPTVFAAAQTVCAVALALIVVLAGGFAQLGPALLCSIVGVMLPGFALSHHAKLRARIIRNGLPDVLDLLIVCLESGCSLDQAILKATEELAVACPPLADELALMSNEIRAGTPRLEAFRHFAERTQVDDVRSVVSMLIQTDRYGTSVAHALRVHADMFRARRRQSAEERAARAGVKLVFPLVFCLFPAFYLITLGPAIVQFVRVFFGVVMKAE